MPQVSKNWVADISKYYNNNHKKIMDRSESIVEKKDEIVEEKLNIIAKQTITPPKIEEKNEI